MGYCVNINDANCVIPANKRKTMKTVQAKISYDE